MACPPPLLPPNEKPPHRGPQRVRSLQRCPAVQRKRPRLLQRQLLVMVLVMVLVRLRLLLLPLQRRHAQGLHRHRDLFTRSERQPPRDFPQVVLVDVRVEEIGHRLESWGFSKSVSQIWSQSGNRGNVGNRDVGQAAARGV